MEQLAVRTRDGFEAIGVGSTKGYELINSGRLKIIKIGRGTRITVESIKQYVADCEAKQSAGA